VVPELPTKISAFLMGNPAPAPVPWMRRRWAPPSVSIGTPTASRASRITCVSSESSAPSSVVVPRASAASSSARLEMLFDPGSWIVPAARVACER
jgi:hypothetical protein